MVQNRLCCNLLFALSLLCSCSKNSHEPRSTATSYATARAYSEAELNDIIVSGMSMAEVTNTFGVPGATVPGQENVVLVLYTFPLEITSRSQGRHLTGFTVKMSDGKVLSWSPIIGESPNTFQPGTSQGSFGEQSFELFLVTGSLTNVLDNFESGGQLETSTLKIPPDIAFKAKVFAGSSGNQTSGTITVILVMTDQDVAKLKKLTENNFGKRTLLVCRNRVVAAPTITEPIASKQFMFTVKDSRVLDVFRSK